MKYFTFICLLTIVVGVSGCDPEYDRVISEAWVLEDSIKVMITSERPALVIIEYATPMGGCREYYDTQFTWEGGNIYSLDVRQIEPHPDWSGDCPEGVYDHIQQFILGYLDSGHYIVHVNDVTKAFEITSEPGCDTIK